MRSMLKDNERMSVYFKSNQDPKEYSQAQNLLKQMEIESMNFMESQEYV
jgi:GTP cyclohydrolase II